MRIIILASLVVVGTGIEAMGSPRTNGGSSGGGGRLGQVSAGLGAATTNGGGAGGGRSATTGERSWAAPCPDVQYRRRVYDGRCERRCPDRDMYRARDGACVRRTLAVLDVPDATLEAEAQGTPSRPKGTARVEGYLGGQKVFESDGALALELAVTDRWFRFSGALTRFYERQPHSAALTLTVPSLAFGVRVEQNDTTRVYIEAGVVAALTRNDPMMDSSLNGVLGGVHAEHSLTKRTTLIGSAKLMGFEDDVRAASLRAGVRYRHVQASLSVLDFNVGPALYGPEIGVGFGF